MFIKFGNRDPQGASGDRDTAGANQSDEADSQCFSRMVSAKKAEACGGRDGTAGSVDSGGFTTAAFGEEGGNTRRTVTTAALGEEGGQPHGAFDGKLSGSGEQGVPVRLPGAEDERSHTFTTRALAEEGGRSSTFTSQSLGEEGGAGADRRPFVESLDRAPATTELSMPAVPGLLPNFSMLSLGGDGEDGEDEDEDFGPASLLGTLRPDGSTG